VADRDHRVGDGRAPPTDDLAVIRNVVIHITNEQPLLADLYEMPVSTDVSLVCTNIRMMDGKKPLFIDRTNSVFMFPYQNIRFLEIFAEAATGPTALPQDSPADATSELDVDADGDLELDEDFLRRIREV
jgi:hypothetical protein